MRRKLSQLMLQAGISTSAPKLSRRQGLKGFKREAPLKWFEIPGRTTVKDTPKAARSAQRLEGEEALQMYERLRRHGVRPHVPLVLAAIKACGFRNELVKIHGDLVKTKDDHDTTICNALIDAFAKAGGLSDSRQIFDRTVKRDIVSWNTMIKCYVLNREPEKALELFSRLHEDGLLPNSRTYLAALNACALQAGREEAEEVAGRLVKPTSLHLGSIIHSQLVKSQHDLDMYVESALVDMYAKCGDAEQAQKIFDGMEHHDAVCWTALIFGYSGSRGDWALELFTRMKEEGFIPDGHTFSAALNACSTLAGGEQWKRVHGRLLKPGALEKGRELHVELDKLGVRADTVLESALVDMYSKCGSMAEARRIFDKMFRHDAVVWTSLITGYAEYGDGEQALQLFARMQKAGVRPDSRSYVAALGACGSLAGKEGRISEQEFLRKLALEKGSVIHSQLSRSGFESDVFVANSLLDMYCKCGSVEEGEKIFSRMANRDTVSWNSMISGYALNRRGGEALKLFSAMQQLGIKPTSLTYVAALKACGSVAALQTGTRLHSEIRTARLEKQPLVASSLVDFYGKCGCMAEARAVFDSLERRDLVTWNALLSGYGCSGDSSRVFEVFEGMLEQELEVDSVTMLGLLTACSHAGMVEEGKRYLTEMPWKYNLSAGVEHYCCVVDMLGRANRLAEAVSLIREMRLERSSVVWISLLAACYKWRNVETGKLAFQGAVDAGGDSSAAHVLMANIYASVGMWEDCERIKTMVSSNSKASAGGESCWIDNGGAVLRFPDVDQAQTSATFC